MNNISHTALPPVPVKLDGTATDEGRIEKRLIEQKAVRPVDLPVPASHVPDEERQGH